MTAQKFQKLGVASKVQSAWTTSPTPKIQGRATWDWLSDSSLRAMFAAVGVVYSESRIGPGVISRTLPLHGPLIAVDESMAEEIKSTVELSIACGRRAIPKRGFSWLQAPIRLSRRVNWHVVYEDQRRRR